MIGQQLLNGLVVGGVYSLFAVGFTLIFSIHRIMNLGYGSVFMSSAFVGLYCVQAGAPFWASFLIAIVASGILSVGIELLAFRPLRRLPAGDFEFACIISSIGAGLFVTNVAQQISKTEVMRFPFGTVPVEVLSFLGLRVTSLQLVMLGSACIAVTLLTAYLYRTQWGRQIRAVGGNQRTASLLGINPNIVFFQTFFISGALAGAAGVLIGLAFNSIHFLMGEPYLLRALVAIVLGGLGSIPGALIGGVALGVLQTLGAAYLPPLLVDAAIFSVLFAVLLVRPDGLFGGGTAEGVNRRI